MKSMDRIKKLMGALVCALAGILLTTSCFGDDDNGGNTGTSNLSPEQKTTAVNNVSGSYQGYVYFVNADKNKEDSVKTYWTVTREDSVFTINALDVTIFAHYVSNEEAKNILRASSPQTFTAVMHPIYMENYYYEFTLLPKTDLIFTTEYNGENHQVRIGFTNSVETISPYGQLIYYSPLAIYMLTANNKSNEVYKYLRGNLLIGTITIDTTEYPVKTVCGFLGKQ